VARRRNGRAVDGILVLDKPMGISSNRALQRVKHLYNAAKAGHTGSLDPLATGVLPLCLGEATKFSQYLLDADKAYQSTFVLGTVTNTGEPRARCWKFATRPLLQKVT
jgi:tRNA pseudouridine55 synthase